MISSKIHGKTLHILSEMPMEKGGAIYMANHSCRWDVPVAVDLLKRHTYVLAGKQSLQFMDWLGFEINGTVWVDRKNRNSRSFAYKRMKKLLMKNNNLLIFPEGTWNLLPSSPMLPIYWGGITLAMETGKPLIPVVMEYRGNDVYIAFDKPIHYLKNQDKKQSADMLRDTMATLRWNIWEYFPKEKRSEIDMKEWDREKEKRLKEYPKLNYSNDTEVVKQSISSMLSIFMGMSILIVSIVLFIKFIDKINLVILISIYICIIFIVDLILYKILTKYGTNEYNKLIV